MNPYVEQEDIWHDFHQRFATTVADMLGDQLAPRYIVKIDQSTYIHELPGDARRPLGRPDAYVAPSGAPGAVATGPTALAAPEEVLLPEIDVERLPYVEIRDRLNREVIAVIELLSPSNKAPGPDREQYLGKRGQLLTSRAHLVEIDLLRGWGRLPPIPERRDYCLLVSRSERRPRAELWSFGLRDPLPAAPIPLRAPEPDALLDLRAVIDRIYDRAHYDTYIYQGDPQPPLGSEDAAWARQYVPVG
jgi:hypothetical protein